MKLSAFRFLLAVGEGSLAWHALLVVSRRHPQASRAARSIALPALALAVLLLGLAPAGLPPLAWSWPPLVAAALAVVLIGLAFFARWSRAMNFLILATFVLAHLAALALLRDDAVARGLRVMGPRFAIVALLAGAAAIGIARAVVGPSREERDFLALAMLATGAMWSVGTVRWMSRLFVAGPESRPELWSLLTGHHAFAFWAMVSCIAVAPPLLVLSRSRATLAVASLWLLTAQGLDAWLGVVVPAEYRIVPTPTSGEGR